MYIMIICHWAILHYNMSFQTIAGRSDGVFWWFPALFEDEEKICWIHQNYLVALRHLHFGYYVLNLVFITFSFSKLIANVLIKLENEKSTCTLQWVLVLLSKVSLPFQSTLFYTERQKKLITSSECHSLKSKASTWIIFGHRLGKFIFNKHI